MDLLRVIAVQFDYDDFAACCIYKNNKLLYYDKEQELYKFREYINTFEDLEYLISINDFEWTDFYITKGDIVRRNYLSKIVVNDEVINESDEYISPLDKRLNSDNLNKLIDLYYEYLKSLCKDDKLLTNNIMESYTNGEFQNQIKKLLDNNPIHNLSDEDKSYIIKSRIFGLEYFLNLIKVTYNKQSRYKSEQIHYLFSRFFKLVNEHYISF